MEVAWTTLEENYILITRPVLKLVKLSVTALVQFIPVLFMAALLITRSYSSPNNSASLILGNDKAL
jgi:hypothetical protein